MHEYTASDQVVVLLCLWLSLVTCIS